MTDSLVEAIRVKGVAEIIRQKYSMSGFTFTFGR